MLRPLIVLISLVSLVACQPSPPATPSSSAAESAPPTVEIIAATEAAPQATTPLAAPATSPQAMAVATAPPSQEVATPNLEIADDTGDIEEMLAVTELPVLGTPGRYTNIAFGYVVHYPETWFTGFGNRPMLTSFSNLDPGGTNRESMRTTGCLFEVNVAPNVYGFTLQTLLAQMPQTYASAETFQLGGEDAVRLLSDNENLPYRTDTVQVVHDGRLFTIVADMARSAEESCRPVWEDVLNQWTWFTPDFVPYRNIDDGYSISYPRSWSVIDSADQGVLIASQAAAGATIEEMAGQGMVVRTSVVENPTLLPLKQWLLANGSDLGLTSDIELDTLRGVRSVTTYAEGIQQMSGYFQGPLGNIYMVETLYPSDRQREFRPYANAMLYSFGF